MVDKLLKKSITYNMRIYVDFNSFYLSSEVRFFKWFIKALNILVKRICINSLIHPHQNQRLRKQKVFDAIFPKMPIQELFVIVTLTIVYAKITQFLNKSKCESFLHSFLHVFSSQVRSRLRFLVAKVRKGLYLKFIQLYNLE